MLSHPGRSRCAGLTVSVSLFRICLDPPLWEDPPPSPTIVGSMTSASSFDLPPALPRLLDRMMCPGCRAHLDLGAEALTCQGCGTEFPIRGGIPLLAIRGTTETWERTDTVGALAEVEALLEARPRPRDGLLTDAGESTSEDYQTWYQDLERARRYNEEYRERPTKRWSTNREYALLQRLLGSQPHSQVLLDLPSGGGRLSGQLARHTELLVEADIGFGQLLYGREQYDGRDQHGDGGDDRVWMTASAFHIPLRDESVDGVVCCRLCHHLPTVAERERLVAELLRVARRFVIMTFFDHHSVKNLLRRARRPLDGKPPKMTMTVERVGELAREHGAELVAYPPLSRLFSGHRYALMVRT
jgi:uncharacterized protein YbaR (Trm112 family)